MITHRTLSRRTGWAPLVTALLAMELLVTASCGTGKSGEAQGEAATPVVAARTAPVSVEPFARTLSAIGTVVARPGRYAALSAPSATRISRVYVSVGARVSAGQPLVEFEQVGFDAAATGAQAALVAAQRGYERAQRLANEGIVPRKDAEQASAELARVRSEAVTARRAQQLSVLRSPVSGVVTRMTAVLGAPADAGQVLVEVADPSSFDVVLSLAPTEAADVRPGSSVSLTAGDKSGGEQIGAGRVASVGAAVDSGSRAVQVRVTVTTPRRALRLGESVNGAITVETRPNAIVVPTVALVPGEAPGDYKVFVVDKSGVAHEREVKVGGRTETRAEITEGLQGGETVVTQGAFGMQDSARVARPVATSPAP